MCISIIRLLHLQDGSGGVASSTGSTPHLHGDPNDLWLSRPDIQCVRATFSSAPHGREWASSGEGQEREKEETNTTDAFLSPSCPEPSCHSALYSLYVVGGSGVLTHYHLLPRPHEEAREGDDAPISLSCRPQICWRLLRSVERVCSSLPLLVAPSLPLPFCASVSVTEPFSLPAASPTQLL